MKEIIKRVKKMASGLYMQSFEYYEQGKLKKWTHFSDPDVKEFEIETKSEIPEEIIISLQFISQVTSSVGLASTRAGGSYYQVRKDFFNNVGSLLIRSDVEDAKMSFWGFEEQLEQEHYFLNGELDLKILYKNSFGKVERKESIRNDIRCELVQRDMRNFAMLTKITYYPNGKPNEIKHFNEETSLKEGIWVSHYFNGEKKIEGFYRHDLKHGLWKYRDDTGKLIKKEKYKNGVLIVK